MSFPTRHTSHFELSDKLRQLKRFGVDVPILSTSIYSPDYVGTRKDGVEVYRHAGRTIEVRPGEVIDSHGNVVNLGRLEAQTLVIKTSRTESPVEDRYRDLTITPVPPLGATREEVQSKYAHLFGDRPDLSKIDVGRILHPERHPDFSKPTRREYIK